MIRIVHANSSWRDQLKIVEYLDDVRPGDTARRFLVALDETIMFIAESPTLATHGSFLKARIRTSDFAW